MLDAGVRYKRIQQAVHFQTRRIRFALITHEHMDHAKAVKDLVFAGVPTYMTKGTASALEIEGAILLEPGVDAYRVVRDDHWRFLPFPTVHDAAEPVGFFLTHGSDRILYATDTHYIPARVQAPTHLILECNYCSDILMRRIETGEIAGAMKNRLLHSHMSLERLLEYLKSQDLSHCCKIVLVHLSAGNSDEDRMIREVTKATGIHTVAAAKGMSIDLSAVPF